MSGVTISKGSPAVPLGHGLLAYSKLPQRPGNNGGGIVNAGTLTLGQRGGDGQRGLPRARSRSGSSSACFPSGIAHHSGGTGGNGGNGGGIYNNGQLTIQNSTITATTPARDQAEPGAPDRLERARGRGGRERRSGGYAGGIFNENARTATITNPTIRGNSVGRAAAAGAREATPTANGNGGDGGFAGSGGVGGGIVNFGSWPYHVDPLREFDGSGRQRRGRRQGVTAEEARGRDARVGVGGRRGLLRRLEPSRRSPTTRSSGTRRQRAGPAGGIGHRRRRRRDLAGGLGLVQLSFDTITGNSPRRTAGAAIASLGTDHGDSLDHRLQHGRRRPDTELHGRPDRRPGEQHRLR